MREAAPDPGRPAATGGQAPTFFRTAAEFGAWLAKHAATERELIVGFNKQGSGLASMSWPESVDEALCEGWIDGVRTNIDARSYKIRFTRRKPTSTWSARNIERVSVLQSQGRMRPAGLEAFALRREGKSKTYAYEQVVMARLEREEEARFRQRRRAWEFFAAQPPSYRHLAVWHIISAKRAATREARLAKLIDASGTGVRL